MTSSAKPRRSADILAFPAQRPALTGNERAAPGSDGAERLRLALSALDAAVKRQRNAVADWRTAIGDLRTRMGELGGSVSHYRDTLGNLGTRADHLREAARRLQARADALEAQTKG